jgi:hypothetical protein
MQANDTVNEVLDGFTRGIFPTAHTFTEQQIEAIRNIIGVDSRGTFADAPMEQALLCEYKLDARSGENTWPALAEAIREDKRLHLSRFSGARERNVNSFKENIANCLTFGMSPDEIVEQAKIACGIPF